MIISQGSNEYHHIQITDIVDLSSSENPIVIIKGYGKIMMRDSNSRTGYKIVRYYVRVYVRGMMMHYVNSELDIKDLVFVVGRSNMCKPTKYSEVRMVDADYIYKEDWVKFYNNYGNINPQDTEDRL